MIGLLEKFFRLLDTLVANRTANADRIVKLVGIVMIWAEMPLTHNKEYARMKHARARDAHQLRL